MRPEKTGWFMRSVIVFAVFALSLGVLVPNYLTRRDAHLGASSAPAALAARPTAPAGNGAVGSRAMIVPRDPRGHFLVEGRVDGRPKNSMVDTDASVIALGSASNRRSGILPPKLD